MLSLALVGSEGGAVYCNDEILQPARGLGSAAQDVQQDGGSYCGWSDSEHHSCYENTGLPVGRTCKTKHPG